MENKEETKTTEEVVETKQETENVSQNSSKKPGLYTAGLICGIVGLCLFWSTWIGLICGVLGIVFGAVTLSKTNNKTPIILGGIAVGLAIIMMIVYFVIGGKIFNHYEDKVENIFDEAEKTIEKIDYDNDYSDEEENNDTDGEKSLKEEAEEKSAQIKENMDNALDDAKKEMDNIFNNSTN